MKLAIGTAVVVLAIIISGCEVLEPPIVDKFEYDSIQQGMPYAEVTEIIGAEGEELSSVYTQGVPGVMESITTIMYMWQNADGSNMNAMFQNDKLVTKAQFGLS